MRNYLHILPLVFFLGCLPAPNQVEYVIPNGFHGTVRILHKAGAPELPVVNGRYIFKLPENGVMFFGGYDPLCSYLCKARFANGDPIWVSRRFGDHPERGQIGLFGGSTQMAWHGVAGENNGKLMPDGLLEYRFFIGTVEQWKSSAD